MEEVLSSNYYDTFPLMVDVRVWGISDVVTIGAHSAEVVDEVRIYDLDCWECQVDENLSLYYEVGSGFFVGYIVLDSDTSDPYDMWIYSRHVTLTERNITGPGSTSNNERAVFITGIFVELAIIAWLLVDRHEKSKSITV